MKTTIEILSEDALHYLELKYAVSRCDRLEHLEEAEAFESSSYHTLLLPKDLSGEDKFAAVLIDMFHSGLGLTSRRLMEWFGWTKYKCYKIARNCKYCRTVTLICEEGGYGGTGWMLNTEMDDAMRKVAAEKFPCRECVHLMKWKFDGLYVRKDHIGTCCKPPCIKVTNTCGCITGDYEKKEVEIDKPF